MSPDGYLMPVLDDTFDAAAAQMMRNCVQLYNQLSPELKGILENIALTQGQIPK